jgi:hypothetical protein
MNDIINALKDFYDKNGLLKSFFIIWGLVLVFSAIVKLLGIGGIAVITLLVAVSSILIYTEDKHK